MYMREVSAECKYLIYHSDIIIKYHDYIYFNLDYCSHFTLIASAYDLKAFQNKCGRISIRGLKKIVGFSFWY